MSHVRAVGDQRPIARPIIHLGATSCYVTDSADWLQICRNLDVLFRTLWLLYKISQIFLANLILVLHYSSPNYNQRSRPLSVEVQLSERRIFCKMNISLKRDRVA